MVRKMFFLAMMAAMVGCASQAKSEGVPQTLEGDVLTYEVTQQGSVKVYGLSLVSQGGTYDYALAYESPDDGLAMLFTLQDDEAKMVRRMTLARGRGVLHFNANSDWVDNARGLKLELTVKGSTKKTILTFEGK